MAVLTNDQKLILDMVRQVSREVLWEKAPQYDKSGEYPWPQLRVLAELGLLGMTTPEEWGGAGLDSVTWVLAMEEIAAADPSVAVILSVTSGLPQYMLQRFGRPEQKKKYLVPLAKGEWIGAFCLTEPHAGSDPASLKTRAKRVPGGWQLDGVKSWITSGGQAHLYVVMARGEAGICSFLVEKDTPGLSFGRPEEKMGLHAAHTAEMRLDGVFIPEENLLGTEGEGLAQALAGLDSGRLGIAAQAVGMARAAFELAKQYAAERTQFGRRIREFQGVSFKLAEMHAKIAAARALTLEAAAKKDRGERFTLEASTAKLFASETAVDVTRQAVQILGGYGYHRDYRVERYYRDAKVTEIYEGTNEIQKMVIARELYR
ncbi:MULTISPECIES: acyl-CoA dehydrogenase family protein [unclassified Meiothermus]|uniref:acyl-CoA dehydrogenase family protein n=1 Tax=unclassified Meiothermus TaxID=370471 RepID=UPI000D7CAFE3|nr:MULTISPECIES: acyl-CoA dehydrogenase family protein [unclassified Meiothermus]PZA08522.1 acyl-CoA dehydrogenase [Meiothermus sp. Pnk-1]RYM36872.1 acyl-CoA dehydrogenase [Meiothermus sp. PNK-Is4]